VSGLEPRGVRPGAWAAGPEAPAVGGIDRPGHRDPGHPGVCVRWEGGQFGVRPGTLPGYASRGVPQRLGVLGLEPGGAPRVRDPWDPLARLPPTSPRYASSGVSPAGEALEPSPGTPVVGALRGARLWRVPPRPPGKRWRNSRGIRSYRCGERKRAIALEVQRFGSRQSRMSRKSKECEYVLGPKVVSRLNLGSLESCSKLDKN
jgi:hypothetical protein